MVSLNTYSRKSHVLCQMKNLLLVSDFFIKYIHISCQDFPPKGLAQQAFTMRTG